MFDKSYQWKQLSCFVQVTTFLLFLLFISTNLMAQERTVTGTILDKSGSPLPGVNVVLKGTTSGTLSDINGFFTIKVPGADAVLTFTYVGYNNQEITVGSQTDIKIVLEESIEEIDQVVVVGYGVQRKSDLTGAIASVSSEKLSKTPLTGLDQALQGMAAGVNIVPVSGRPGSGVNIQIRGISSINGTEPKVIIDGVAQPYDALNRINPDDVERIEVLKDASSAAIYGASGGNGVIIVTTKKGKSGDMKVNYNAYVGAENVIKKLDLMNSRQWIELMDETSTSKTPFTTRLDTFKTYDWQDIIFKQAISQNHDLSLSGGTDRSTFLFSTGYTKTEGIIKNTNHERLTMRLNSEHKINRFFTFEEKVSFTNDVTDGFADWEYTGYYQNPVMPGLQMVPYQPAYDESGKWTEPYGGGVNPVVALDLKDNKIKNNYLEGNFSLIFTPVKGLSYVARYTQGLFYGDDKEYKKKYYASATNRLDQNSLYQKMTRGFSWNIQNVITYSNKFADSHNLTLMAGHNAERRWSYDIFGTRVDMPSDLPELLYLKMSTNDTLSKQIIEGDGTETRNYQYFGRLNYDYQSKYLFTFNLSRDYDANFGPLNRAGTFPSFSLGWKFSEEEFVKDLGIFDFGKIRFGYGQTGANAKKDFPYLTTVVTPASYMYSTNNRSAAIGAGPDKIANPGLKWETIHMTNYGLDLGFFKNKLNISAEYFIKVNDGMIMSQTIPYAAGSYGMTMPDVNIGSIENRGFEFTIDHKNTVGEFKYGLDFNISFVKNNVKSLATDSIKRGGVHNVAPITLTREGSPVSQFWGFKTNGMFTENDPTEINKKGKKVITNQTFRINGVGDTVYLQPNARPGDVRYVDVNEDGVLDDNDKVILGSPLPKFTFGFSVNLEYKMFDLNAFFYGSYGNKVFNGIKQYLYYSQGYGNRAADFANRYKDEIVKDGIVVVSANKNTTIPRFAADNYTKPRDFYVEDGSYLRLSSIQLGFTFPTSLTKRVGIGRFRMYVGAKNLFTISSYSGFDPVVSGGATSGNNGTMAQGIDIGGYPTTSMYMAGINLEF